MPETYNIPFFGNNASLAAEILGAHYQEQSRRSASVSKRSSAASSIKSTNSTLSQLKSRFTRSNRSSLDAQGQKVLKDKTPKKPVKMAMPVIKMMN
jgi:hypothetical protein